jgi:hypothetical protein
VLIDADRDVALMPLTDGQVIDFAALPTRNLNVRADVGSGVALVVFGLDADDAFRTEKGAPYALAGDSGGDYRAWTPSLGSHTLAATAYDANGQPGATLRVGFTVVDGGTATLRVLPAVPLSWRDAEEDDDVERAFLR